MQPTDVYDLGEHEAPGPYATGLIVKTYTSGQTIDVQVCKQIIICIVVSQGDADFFDYEAKRNDGL